MRAISQKFPQDLFIVYGDGEDNEDIWKCVFKNGQQEHLKAKITFDDSILEAEFEADEAIQEILTD